MARWLKTGVPHKLIQHVDVDPSTTGTILVKDGSLFKLKSSYEAFRLKQVTVEITHAPDQVSIPLEHPNPNYDRLVSILKHVGSVSYNTTLYEFTYEETSKFTFDSRFVRFDGYLYLNTREEFVMTSERFFWTTPIDVGDYQDVVTISIDWS